MAHCGEMLTDVIHSGETKTSFEIETFLCQMSESLQEMCDGDLKAFKRKRLGFGCSDDVCVIVGLSTKMLMGHIGCFKIHTNSKYCLKTWF